MYARALDEAAASLRELRHDEVCRLGVAAVAMALAVAATRVCPDLALPLFLGGLCVGALGAHALWHRWDLVDRLADDPDAYVIPEVRSYASREAAMPRRRTFAALIRSGLVAERPCVDACIADELETLATELEDDGLVLDPARAIACFRLLSEVPSLDQMSKAELRSRVRRIRSGFSAAPGIVAVRGRQPARKGALG
jgi:hypothetical protein